jgi:hypothetical protein
MMEDKDWLKSLQNKMEGYEEPAPEGLWEGIESSVFPERKGRVITIPLLWRSVAVAAVVALGVFAGLRLFESGEVEQMDKPREILVSDRPSSVVPGGSRDSSVEIVASSGESELFADNRPQYKRSGSHSDVKREKHDETVVAEPAGVVSVPEPDESCEVVNVVDREPDPEGNENRPKKDTESDLEGEDWSDYLSATDDSGKSMTKAAVLDVSFSGASSDVSSKSFYDLQMFYRGSNPSSANDLITDGGKNMGNDSQIQTRGHALMHPKKNASTVMSRSEHNRPVRLALMVNYPLGKTFGMETGLSYTSLHSRFSNESGRTVSITNQTLRYLGIPLNASVSIIDSKWVCFYAGGGGMVEKCLSGKSVTTALLVGVKQGESVSKNLKVKPLLWSLNASAGIQAKLTRQFGVYVEPGLSYHFDDKSDVQTIYKERPLDFVLTFGARFSLQ